MNPNGKYTKVVFLGSTSVGKTSVINYELKFFDQNDDPTIGACYHDKIYVIDGIEVY